MVPDTVVGFGSEWFEFDGLREPPDHLVRDFGFRRGGWDVSWEGGGAGAHVTVERGVIRMRGDNNLCYALLVQLVRQRHGFLPRVKLEFEPHFGFRCFHLDIARGGVPTIYTFKRIVRLLFLLGYNAFAVYFEDLYPWRSHPDIGVHRGRLTHEEWSELCGYAKQYGLDVIPSLELLGHMENILSLPQYSKFRELWWQRSDGSLNASSQEARQLAYDLLEDVLDTSESPYLFVGGDETWSLGRGRSLNKDWVYRGPDLYLEHYREIVSRVKRRGKRPIVWGDMITGVYLEPSERKLWGRVIEDRLWDEVIVGNWDYTPQDQAHFEEIIDLVGRVDRQLACPGASNWNRLYPNFDDASKNIEGFLGAARKKKLMGFVLTAWGDDGSECLFSFLDPIILLGIEAAESVDTSRWKQKWSRLTGEPEAVVEARTTLGRKEVADNLKKALYRHEQRAEPTGSSPSLPDSLWNTALPEDLAFIRRCVAVAFGSRQPPSPSDYIGLANTYSKLWLGERKIQGLTRVLTKFWGSAGAVELEHQK
jgi:hexosaminidase